MDSKGKNTDVLNCVFEFHSLLTGLQIISYLFARDIPSDLENIVKSTLSIPVLGQGIDICVIILSTSLIWLCITLDY